MKAVYVGNMDTLERYPDDRVKFVNQSLLDSELYRQAVYRYGGTKILSLGHGGVREYHSDESLMLAHNLGITYICTLAMGSPDVPFHIGPIRALVGSTNALVCPVLVGDDYEGLKRAYSELLESGVEIGAVGLPLSAGGGSDTDSDTVSGFNRFRSICRLVEDGVFESGVSHFLYGSYNPAEFAVYGNHFSSLVSSSITLGITGTPYTLAYFGATLNSNYGAMSSEPIRPGSEGPRGLGVFDVYHRSISREQARTFVLNREVTSRFVSGSGGDAVVNDFLSKGGSNEEDIL